MLVKEKNYAFIDSQNLNLGMKSLGWNLDYKRFRIYLREKYSVVKAYVFIGYLESNKKLYLRLEKSGFDLVFKPITVDYTGNIKGNVDADMVLQAMIDIDKYNKAIIVTSDGDFYSLVRFLYSKSKLGYVMSPRVESCSKLLKKFARERIFFMDKLKNKLEYIRQSKSPKRKSTG